MIQHQIVVLFYRLAARWNLLWHLMVALTEVVFVYRQSYLVDWLKGSSHNYLDIMRKSRLQQHNADIQKQFVPIVSTTL